MSPDRYYRTEIREGPKSRQFYFYASTAGLTGPEYGFTVSDSWIDDAYESAIEELRKRLQREHDAVGDGVVVTVSDSVEVNSDELVCQDPRLNVYVEDAIKLGKQEYGSALHPIKITWAWDSVDAPRTETMVFLRLSDDTGVFGKGFTLQALKNQSSLQDRIGRLYRELLQFSSQTRVMNLLRANAGARGE